MKTAIIFSNFLLISLICYSAPATNTVKLDSLMSFSIRKKFGPPAGEFRSDELLCYSVKVLGTNYVFCRLPAFEERFEFHLFDSKGREVEKTTSGVLNSKTPSLAASRAYASNHYKSHLFFKTEAHDWFRPEDLFIFKQAGIYDLEVRYRILFPTTNGLPNYTIIMSGHNFSAAGKFGFFISEVVRVKILKK